MREFGLLPTAERIYVDGMDTNEIYDESAEDNNRGIALPTWVFYVFFVILIALMVVDQNVFLICFGIFFILLAITKWGKRRLNVQSLKITLKSNIPFLIIGVILISIGILVDMETVDIDNEKTSIVFGTLFFSALTLALGGRLIFLSVKAAAISKRKKECTESVVAEHYSYRDPGNLAEITGYDISLVGDPVYKYYCQGNVYKFAITENIPVRYDKNRSIEIFVDPEQPERYYSEKLFCRNAKQIKFLLKLVLFLLVVIAAIVGIIFYLS